MKIYTGIGSRETPDDILFEMSRIAKFYGYKLRSGGASGADIAFERGCDEFHGEKEIYIPWCKFNGSSSKMFSITLKALEMAEKFHPNWAALSQPAKLIMARNCYQVLGQDLETPTELVICWTKDGKASGGTGQAIRIANHYEIPVLNLKTDKWLIEERLCKQQKESEK